MYLTLSIAADVSHSSKNTMEKGQWWCLPPMELGTGSSCTPEGSFWQEGWRQALRFIPSQSPWGEPRASPCASPSAELGLLLSQGRYARTEHPGNQRTGPARLGVPQVCHLTSSPLFLTAVARRQLQASCCRQNSLELGNFT